MKRSAEDIERIAALEAELGRYSMCAGHAEQRRAESRAVREALGFGADADDVSPRDLLDALARQKARWQAEAVEHAMRLETHIDRVIYANQLRRQAEDSP